jgi:alpha-methylacyl-CoA racemase
LPAPRFSRTVPDTPRPAAPVTDAEAVLKDWV